MRRWLGQIALPLWFLALMALYVIHPGAYRALISLQVHDAWEFPFLDTHVVLAWIECHRAGVDVYVRNPCDVMDRVLAQSPLWLALAPSGLGVAATPVIGLALGLAFCAALFLLGGARDRRGGIVMLAACLSPATLYALERGNTDLVVFVLLAPLARWAPGGVGRLCGYALVLLAGALKFFPLAALAAAIGESLGRLAALGLASLAVVGVFILHYAADLPRLAWHGDDWFGTSYGALKLWGGLRVLAPGHAWLAWVVCAAVAGLAGARAVAIARRGAADGGLAGLDQPMRDFFLLGAGIMVGSFLIGQNTLYRAIFLIPTLPALLALGRAGPARPLWMAVLFVLWSVFVPLHLHDWLQSEPFFKALWLPMQLLWWWLIAGLAGLVLGHLPHTPAWLALAGYWRARLPSAPNG